MADRLRELSRELDLPAAPAPFPMDAKAISRRVERTLSAGQEERKLYMRHKLRLAAILTAAAVALTGTALAVAPILGEALEKALGEFAPFAQTVEGETVDQGIRVKVVSALADSSGLRVYAQIADLTGDRLQNAKVSGWIGVDHTGGSEGSGYAMGCDRVGYDPETKTALYEVRRYNGLLIPDGTPATLKVDRIQPEYTQFETTDPLPLDRIGAKILKSRTLPSGETVLAPGQTVAQMEGGAGVSLSAMGFAADGRLHFLFRLPEGADPERSDVILTIYSNSWTLTQEGGGDTYFNRDFQDVGFTQDGTAYRDFSVPGKPEDLSNIKELTEAYGTIVAAPAVEGTWVVPLTVSNVAERTLAISGLIDHSTLESMVLSPLGLTITSTSPDFTGIGGYPLAVYLADGTVLHPKRGFVGPSGMDGPNLARWDFNQPVDMDQIAGVSLGLYKIPVAHGAAGEGYWLSQLPE